MRSVAEIDFKIVLHFGQTVCYNEKSSGKNMKWQKIGKTRKKRILCSKCNHIWKTGSKLLLVTCTNCGLKVNQEKCYVGMVT